MDSNSFDLYEFAKMLPLIDPLFHSLCVLFLEEANWLLMNA